MEEFIFLTNHLIENYTNVKFGRFFYSVVCFKTFVNKKCLTNVNARNVFKAYRHVLIRVFVVRIKKLCMFLAIQIAPCKDFDQTVRMHRLI